MENHIWEENLENTWDNFVMPEPKLSALLS